MKVIKGILWALVIQALFFGFWAFVVAHSSYAVRHY